MSELCDVGGLYLDEYRRVGNAWRFTRRVEHAHYVTGGAFAAVVRDLAASVASDRGVHRPASPWRLGDRRSVRRGPGGRDGGALGPAGGAVTAEAAFGLPHSSGGDGPEA